MGPRPAPEGEAVPSDPLALAHELVAAKAARETVVQVGMNMRVTTQYISNTRYVGRDRLEGAGDGGELRNWQLGAAGRG